MGHLWVPTTHDTKRPLILLPLWLFIVSGTYHLRLLQRLAGNSITWHSSPVRHNKQKQSLQHSVQDGSAQNNTWKTYFNELCIKKKWKFLKIQTLTEIQWSIKDLIQELFQWLHKKKMHPFGCMTETTKLHRGGSSYKYLTGKNIWPLNVGWMPVA